MMRCQYGIDKSLSCNGMLFILAQSRLAYKKHAQYTVVKFINFSNMFSRLLKIVQAHFSTSCRREFPGDSAVIEEFVWKELHALPMETVVL